MKSNLEGRGFNESLRTFGKNDLFREATHDGVTIVDPLSTAMAARKDLDRDVRSSHIS